MLEICDFKFSQKCKLLFGINVGCLSISSFLLWVELELFLTSRFAMRALQNLQFCSSSRIKI